MFFGNEAWKLCTNHPGWLDRTISKWENWPSDLHSGPIEDKMCAQMELKHYGVPGTSYKSTEGVASRIPIVVLAV